VELKMAKKQTFGMDKTAAKRMAKNSVKVIISEKGKKGHYRFAEKMVRVPDGEDFEKYCDSVVLGK
jgi:hypothetical protein